MGLSTKLLSSSWLLVLSLAACNSDNGYYSDDDAYARPASADMLEASSFVEQVASAGEYEVQAATLVLDRSPSKPVEDLASMLRSDHQKVNAELKEIASDLDIEFPSAMLAKHRVMLDVLQDLSGPDLEKTYLNQLVEGHRASIALFEEATESLPDGELRSFAQSKLPTLRRHLEMASARLAASGKPGY